jgi:hypothetical protein
MDPSPSSPNFQEVRHSRMLLAGIQGKPELGPRLKHSGVTLLGTVPPPQQPIFKGVILDLTLAPHNTKIQIFVMPAWIIGIQVPRMLRKHPCQSGFQHSMLE